MLALNAFKTLPVSKILLEMEHHVPSASISKLHYGEIVDIFGAEFTVKFTVKKVLFFRFCF